MWRWALWLVVVGLLAAGILAGYNVAKVEIQFEKRLPVGLLLSQQFRSQGGAMGSNK